VAIYAISDLHLSFQTEKPMNKFGNLWEEYEEKMKFNWNNLVEKNDLVLIPGDISWATYLSDAYTDFKFIDDLNGIKLISKGNHDYWWETLTKLNAFKDTNDFNTINFIHNSAYNFNGSVICAAKGYDFTVEEKYREREKIRLELSLQEGVKLGEDIIAMLHYPPFTKSRELIPDIGNLLEQYKVKTCIYGHLHYKGHLSSVNDNINGIDYRLVSCDFLNFSPILLR
jgi:predicted phosphohydrolase